MSDKNSDKNSGQPQSPESKSPPMPPKPPESKSPPIPTDTTPVSKKTGEIHYIQNEAKPKPPIPKDTTPVNLRVPERPKSGKDK